MPPTDTNIYPGQHNNTEAQRHGGTEERERISHAETQRTQRGGGLSGFNRVENVEYVEGCVLLVPLVLLVPVVPHEAI